MTLILMIAHNYHNLIKNIERNAKFGIDQKWKNFYLNVNDFENQALNNNIQELV